MKDYCSFTFFFFAILEMLDKQITNIVLIIYLLRESFPVMKLNVLLFQVSCILTEEVSRTFAFVLFFNLHISMALL